MKKRGSGCELSSSGRLSTAKVTNEERGEVVVVFYGRQNSWTKRRKTVIWMFCQRRRVVCFQCFVKDKTRGTVNREGYFGSKWSYPMKGNLCLWNHRPTGNLNSWIQHTPIPFDLLNRNFPHRLLLLFGKRQSFGKIKHSPLFPIPCRNHHYLIMSSPLWWNVSFQSYC